MSPLLSALLGALLGAAVTAGLLARRRRVRPGTPPDDHTERLADAGRQLATVAHELNNPLTAIQAFAQDLQEANPLEHQREALMVIRHQARRARLLVRGLLEQVRAEPPRVDRIAPASLVDPLVPVFDRECRERGIVFDRQVEPNLPMLEGDAAGLEQVLTNLLQNAARSTPSGGRIGLVLRARGRLVEFVVQDTGPGIPADLLDRVFEPFFTTRPAGEGTGLGLAVSQTIVRRHRGTLVAENVPPEEGGGARFTVALPLVDRRAREREPLDEEGSGTGTVAGSGRRILVVEDEATIRIALRRYLEPRGWIVELAADGPAALDALEQGGHHAILCDVRIGSMSGMDLYDRMVARRPALKERIVLISGDAGAADVASFQARTGAVVLQKPFELAALAARLDQLGGPTAA